MSARLLSRHVCRVVLPMAAGALLAGLSARVTLAQRHDAADAGAAAHAAPSGENKAGRFQAPQLKIAPAKEPSIVHGGGSAGVDRNAIGLPVVRPNSGQRPPALNLGHPAAIAPPEPSVGAAVFGNRGLQAPRVATPGPQPLVLRRGTIDGAAFTRPETALKPLGGPAKPAATGINGTSFRPKH